MKTTSALRVIAAALIGLATIGLPQASADNPRRDKTEEFFGKWFRQARANVVPETLSDCRDNDPNTNVILQDRTGTVTYTGFLEGTGQLMTKMLIDECRVVQGIVQSHLTLRGLDFFKALTIRFTNPESGLMEERTGGAVVEHVGRGHAVGPGPHIIETSVRILCGTGQLRGIHGVGTGTGSIMPTPHQFWVHFGHHHDVGFDFLCRDLHDDNSNN